MVLGPNSQAAIKDIKDIIERSERIEQIQNGRHLVKVKL